MVNGIAPDPNDDPEDSEKSDDTDVSDGNYGRWTGNVEFPLRKGHNQDGRTPDDRKSSRPHELKISRVASDLSHLGTEGAGASHLITAMMRAFKDDKAKFGRRVL